MRLITHNLETGLNFYLTELETLYQDLYLGPMLSTKTHSYKMVALGR